MNCSFRRRSGEIRTAFRFWSTGRGEFTGDLHEGDFVFAILFYFFKVDEFRSVLW